MDKLVRTVGIHSLAKSQVSRTATDLDAHVAQFRRRDLTPAGPFMSIAAGALTMKVRERRRVVSTVVLVATGVNANGRREVLGVRTVRRDTRRPWSMFFANVIALGVAGVQLVTSDAHSGLKDAIAANIPGSAWQRCRTHHAANLMSTTPRADGTAAWIGDRL